MKHFKLNRLLMLLMGLLTMCVTQVWGQTITPYLSSSSGNTAGPALTVSSSNASSGTIVTDKLTYTATGASVSSSQWRFTANNGPTFTIASGYRIVKIEMQSTSSTDYYGSWSTTAGTASNQTSSSTWTTVVNINAASVTLKTTTAARMKYFKVYYEVTPTTNPYTVTFDAGSNGTCSTSSLTEASAGAGVTLPNVEEKSGFVFKGWATTSGASTANAGVAGDNYKPSSNCTLYAVYGNLYTVTLGDNSATLTQTTEGGNVTLPSRTGNATWTFAGWSTTNNATETQTAPAIIKAGDYKPTANVTLYPVYTRLEGGGSTTVTQDYETAVAPTGWTSNSITRTNGDGISPHGGSYWGSLAVNGTAYIQYNTALTGNATVTVYVARTTNNSNKGEFKIQSKTNTGSWTDRGTAVDVYNTTVDEWQTLSWTGTLSAEQVRILYTGGTTAVRAIDDFSITYGTNTTYYISVIGPTTYTASVVGGLINGSFDRDVWIQKKPALWASLQYV